MSKNKKKSETEENRNTANSCGKSSGVEFSLCDAIFIGDAPVIFVFIAEVSDRGQMREEEHVQNVRKAVKQRDERQSK